MQLTRFDMELTHLDIPRRVIVPCEENETHLIFINDKRELLINKKTGLIDKLAIDSIDYLKENSCLISVYKDNEDPWGMTVDGFNNKIGAFELLSKDDTNKFNGYENFDGESVRVIENGPVRAILQAIMEHNNSLAIVEYIIPKTDCYVDVRIKILANDANVLYKLGFDTTVSDGEFVGQQMFGREGMLKQNKEVTFQKWCGLFNGDKSFTVLNKGTYGGSCADGHMNITLMRTPVYCAHPIYDRPITDCDRCFDHIDMGEREFEYRIMAGNKKTDTEAEIYNQTPYVLYFFPSGNGEKKKSDIILSNTEILMTCYRPTDDGGITIRLYNPEKYCNETDFFLGGKSFNFSFTPFEVKTLLYKNGKIDECNMINL